MKSIQAIPKTNHRLTSKITHPRKLHNDERVSLKMSAKERKLPRVRKEVRQRVRSYCCHCDDETGIETPYICTECKHSRCLAISFLRWVRFSVHQTLALEEGFLLSIEVFVDSRIISLSIQAASSMVCEVL